MATGLQSILVVLDAAAGSHPVLEKAARIAARSGARLRLFCCDHEPRLTARLFLRPDSLSAARAVFLRRRREWLEALAAPLAGRGLEVEIEAAWDAPVHAGILTEVSLARPGLVMKDLGWQSAPGRGLFSHTDWRLMQACPVPVLLTRPVAWSALPRIAAAVDPGHPGDPAEVLNHAILSLGGQLAAWTGGGLSAVHAFQPVDTAALAATAAGLPPQPPAGVAGADMRQAASEAVAALVAGHGPASGGVQLVEGAAVDVLPAWCAANGTDILVVGVVSRSRVVEAVIGSTAERLLDRIPCDLLAVRGPQP